MAEVLYDKNKGEVDPRWLLVVDKQFIFNGTTTRHYFKWRWMARLLTLWLSFSRRVVYIVLYDLKHEHHPDKPKEGSN